MNLNPKDLKLWYQFMMEEKMVKMKDVLES